MTAFDRPHLPKWPFFTADILLLAVAGYICWQGNPPLSSLELLILSLCVALGAVLSVMPFLLEYRSGAKLAELTRLETAVLQVRNIEGLARQISSATSCWQAVQDEAGKAISSAKEIGEAMTQEAHAFQEFLQKANDSERSHLRLELEKARRAQNDWLAVLTGILDHVYAIHQAATRTGQASVIDQMNRFRDTCWDIARRVGLATVCPQPQETYDPELHQLAKEETDLPEGANVGDILATGYRFQGQLVRKALVLLTHQREEPSPLSISTIQQRHDAAQPVEQEEVEPVEEATVAAEPTTEPREDVSQFAAEAEPEPDIAAISAAEESLEDFAPETTPETTEPEPEPEPTFPSKASPSTFEPPTEEPAEPDEAVPAREPVEEKQPSASDVDASAADDETEKWLTEEEDTDFKPPLEPEDSPLTTTGWQEDEEISAWRPDTESAEAETEEEPDPFWKSASQPTPKLDNDADAEANEPKASALPDDELPEEEDWPEEIDEPTPTESPREDGEEDDSHQGKLRF